MLKSRNNSNANTHFCMFCMPRIVLNISRPILSVSVSVSLPPSLCLSVSLRFLFLDFLVPPKPKPGYWFGRLIRSTSQDFLYAAAYAGPS